MIRRIGAMTFVLALVFAVSAWAQGANFEGNVSRVDAASRTIFFTDGRSLVVDPNTEILMNGQAVPLDAIRPGMVVHLRSRTTPVTSSVVTPPSTSTIVANHPPINASGVVASVNPSAGTITFQDGRTVRLTGQSFVWQPTPLAAIQPGQHVFVRDAEPLAFTSPTSGDYRMGTVSRVDTPTHSIIMQDGTVVQISPSTTFDMGRQNVTVAQLHPGDEVVIHIPQQTALRGTPDYSGSALPGSVASGQSAVLTTDHVIIVRTPEAP